MKTILLFGAGKSATSLIDYLGKCSDENEWQLLVCDTNLSLIQSKINNYQSAKAISIDVSDEAERHDLVSKADIVISMLPPALHFLVATDCVRFSKNLLTASYLDKKIQALRSDVERKGLLFLGEMGLDPGIDHMSAMKMIHQIKREEGKIVSFKSHCGGLVSPESDDNPWHYKITWNPANVVTAGSAGAVYLEKNKTIEIPYPDIFKDGKNRIDIPGLFPLAWYANRDSLSYLDTYDLHGAETFIRTTLRYPSFCTGWNKIVNMDFTNNNDHELIKDCKTFAGWFQLKKKVFIWENENSWDEDQFLNPEFLKQIDYLGMRNPEIIPFEVTHSASLLQYLLEKKLAMKTEDKDMIVMLHEMEYVSDDKNKQIRSCLIVKGEDQIHTAMAKTVGLPLGIVAKLILQNKIKLTGLHIPVIPEIYEPVLEELKLNGIQFNEVIKDIS
ncbi:MAG TPA: saccharopine dehydrogenase C-terminal domain-containing protein [Hanamia sp.]|nr:saccharopine dehydrogenase C-terminal domain-containing protein [Hanamia sp.]